jgi:hypothetical protein
MRCVSAREMFFFLHGPSKRKKVVAVFYGFFDGSNTHDGAKVWSLCGFVGEEVAFGPLDDEWNRVLDKPCWPKRLKRFHMVDCVHGDNEFVGWSFAERLAIFGDLSSVLIASPLLALGSVVITEDFAKLEPEELQLLKSQGLGTPLDLSLQYVFQRAIKLTRQTSQAERVGLLFDDDNPKNAERCHEWCNVYRTRFGFDEWLAGIGFGKSQEFTPLQAADLLAYCTYRFTMKRYPDISDPHFPVMPAFLRMIEAVANDGGGFDLESMKQLASNIKNKRFGNAESISLSEPTHRT